MSLLTLGMGVLWMAAVGGGGGSALVQGTVLLMDAANAVAPTRHSAAYEQAWRGAPHQNKK
jgi:hypothetical protein